MFDSLKNKLKKVSSNIEDAFKAPDEVRNERFSICQSCEHLHKTDFCKICSCYMPVKTWLPEASCPLKKWLPISEIKK